MGWSRSLEARPGATVRDTQELAQLDRTEAMARLKMAQADVKEKQAVARAASGGGVPQEIAAAQLEAAEARAELAQHELDRLTLRAPFAGRDRLRAGERGPVRAQGDGDRRARRRHEPEGPRAGRSPGRQDRGPTRRSSSRSRSRPRRSRASCPCSSRMPSFASWPHPSPRPGSSCRIPAASSSRD